MALIRPETRGLVSARLAVATAFAFLLAGCAAGPAAAPPRGSQPAAKSNTPRATPTAACDSFVHTDAALREEIEERAAALHTGPIGSRAEELASLRLAASGHRLVEAGSPGGALEALEKAVSLYGGNGYAYLFLACVHLAEGRRDQAREFAAGAARYLPRDEAVRDELEGLRLSIGAGTRG